MRLANVGDYDYSENRIVQAQTVRKAVVRMLDTLLPLERDGRWDDILAIGESALEGLSGHDLGMAHALIAKAIHHTAHEAKDWDRAMRHSILSIPLLTVGTYVYKRAYVATAAIAVDSGNSVIGGYYLNRFFRMAGDGQDLGELMPFALRFKSFLLMRKKRYREALHLRLSALRQYRELDVDSNTICRTAINVVWAAIRCGDLKTAKREMPTVWSMTDTAVWYGAMAAIMYEEGNLRECVTYGRMSLQLPRKPYDYVDAYDVAQLVCRASRSLAHRSEARKLCARALALAALQSQSVRAVLTLKQRAGGGDSPDQIATRGAGGYHPNACYSTGVA